MKNNLKRLVPSEFKCNPPSRIANSSLAGLPDLKKGRKECKNFFLFEHKAFKPEFTFLTFSPKISWSMGLGKMLENIILQEEIFVITVIKLLKALINSDSDNEVMSFVPT